jgi:hypothetical protein
MTGNAEEELAALPLMVRLVDAARILGMGRGKAYALASADAFPVPIVRIGKRMFVRKVSLVQYLTRPDEGVDVSPHTLMVDAPTLEEVA